MTNLLNPLTKPADDALHPKNFLQLHKLKLLLILSPAAVEKGEICFSGVDLTIAENINAAKKVLSEPGEDVFDAIICDSEINKKYIAELSAFLTTRKISDRVPVLLLVANEYSVKANSLNRIQGIDDIISSNTSVADLTTKITILKKFKFLQEKLPYYVEAPKRRFIDQQYFLKRAVDITLSSFLLIFLSPLIILVGICIKLETRGPVFYTSLRAGKWYRVFTFYKFRTMVVNAEDMITDLKYKNEYKDYQTTFFFKIKDDPRVTRVGRILRRTSLDELPQLINVLKGDMSLVGNRPLPLYEAKTITTDKSAKRFFAPAGITGLWQVKGRSNYNLTVQERINMDIDYAEKHSFLFDLKILLKTPKELIHKSNV